MIYEAQFKPPTEPLDIQYVQEVEEYTKSLRNTGIYSSDSEDYYSCNLSNGGYGALYSFAQELQRSWKDVKAQNLISLRNLEFSQFRSCGELVLIQHGIVLVNDTQVKIFNDHRYEGIADVDKVTVKPMSAITPDEVAKSGMTDERIYNLSSKTRERYGEHYPYTLTILKGPTALEMLAGEVIRFASSGYHPPVS